MSFWFSVKFSAIVLERRGRRRIKNMTWMKKSPTVEKRRSIRKRCPTKMSYYDYIIFFLLSINTQLLYRFRWTKLWYVYVCKIKYYFGNSVNESFFFFFFVRIQQKWSFGFFFILHFSFINLFLVVVAPSAHAF